MSTDVQNREPTEWVNSWISHANCKGDRILLIGDSVTRALRGKLEFFLKKWYHVDLFASSFAITDHLFWRHLQCFFNDEYQYKIIIINYNFHHGYIGDYAGNEKILQTMYQKLIHLCQSFCDRVVVMTGTSCMKVDDFEQLDTGVETELLARNIIAKQAAEDTGSPVFDLHLIMKQGRGVDFKYIDRVHFENSAYFYIAYKMLAELSIIKEAERERVRELMDRFLGIEKITDSIIYLEGEDAYYIYYWLKYFCEDIRIVAWAVTDGGDVRKEICSIPVYEIDRVDNKNSLLIIAANDQYEQQMRDTAEKLGFKKIKSYRCMRSDLYL